MAESSDVQGGSASLNHPKSTGSKFEEHLKLILNASSKLDLPRRHRQVQVQEDVQPENASDGRSFMDYLRACNKISTLQQQIAEKASELHRGRSLGAVQHLVDNDVLEDRIAILQKIDSHLRSVVANKDYLLDQMHASPLNTGTVSIAVHASFHENLLDTFLELSNWIKDSELNLGLAGLGETNSEMDDNMNTITGTTETLLANMNADFKLIKQLQDLVHRMLVAV